MLSLESRIHYTQTTSSYRFPWISIVSHADNDDYSGLYSLQEIPNTLSTTLSLL